MKAWKLVMFFAVPALVGCDGAGDADGERADVTPATARLSDAQVASLLRYIDGSEIATARELLPKLATAPARAYAQMLIDDHTRSRRLARESTALDDSTEVPPQFRTLREVTRTHSAMFMTLPAGRSFDATFLGVQAATHATVADSLVAWRSSVRDDGLRRVIDGLLPVVHAHRDRALAAFEALQGGTVPAVPVHPDSSGPVHVDTDTAGVGPR